jgi:hypothetical protein
MAKSGKPEWMLQNERTAAQVAEMQAFNPDPVNRRSHSLPKWLAIVEATTTVDTDGSRYARSLSRIPTWGVSADEDLFV